MKYSFHYLNRNNQRRYDKTYLHSHITVNWSQKTHFLITFHRTILLQELMTMMMCVISPIRRLLLHLRHQNVALL